MRNDTSKGLAAYRDSADCDLDIKVAVMGCVVNGPGEARGCDLGIAGGEGEGLLFIEGKPIKKIEDKYLLDELVKAAEEAAKKYQ